MAEKENTQVIEGTRGLITVDVIECQEEDKDYSIDNDAAASYEEYGSGLVGAGVTEEVEDMHKDVKYSSLLSYMFKPSHLLTQGFENNRQSQEKLLKKCVLLGHGKIGGRGEEFSVLILMLRSPNIDAVSSILSLWTAQQVI